MCGEEGPDQMSSKSDILGTEPLSVIQFAQNYNNIIMIYLNENIIL